MNFLTMVGLSLLLTFTTEAAIKIKKCNSSNVETIRTIHRNVKDKVTEITNPRTGVALYNLNHIKNEYIGPKDLVPSKKFRTHDRTYTTFHNKVKDTLYKVRNKMNGSYDYICDSARSRHCRGDGGVTAYVLFIGSRPYNRIYFCPLFFQSTKYDQEDTLLHELTHLAANTVHYMGTSFTDAGMIKSANDAYLYGRMMHMNFESLLRVSSYGLMWHKKRSNFVEM